MVFGKMYFRLYDPNHDTVVNKYNESDWNHIFYGMTEDDVRDLCGCINVIILLWCDIKSNTPRGMLYIEESHSAPNEVVIHGGTWDHNPKYFVPIFHSFTSIFIYLLCFETVIKTTCGIRNDRADKFQKSLGFEETNRDELIKYKTLNKDKFFNSSFVQRLIINNNILKVKD